MAYKLFTDGGSRGNPGPAAIGIILFGEDDKLLWFDSKYIGNTTNNIAEYKAILHGLGIYSKMVNEIEEHELICSLDSELVVKQLNGEYKVKDANLREIYEKVIDLKKEMNIKFKHVYREYNKFADKLVNISLDAYEKP